MSSSSSSASVGEATKSMTAGMKSSARSLNAQNKQGSHGTERAKAIPTIAFGMRTSRSTNSLAFESRLSKLKRASSDDMLTKPGGSTAITTSRLKKTITTGGISELSESRFRTNTGCLQLLQNYNLQPDNESYYLQQLEAPCLGNTAVNDKAAP